MDSPSQLGQRLVERVEELALSSVPCYAVLAPEDYSLQLVEAPMSPLAISLVRGSDSRFACYVAGRR